MYVLFGPRLCLLLCLVFTAGFLGGCTQPEAEGPPHAGSVTANSVDVRPIERPITVSYENLTLEESRLAVRLAVNRSNGSASVPHNRPATPLENTSEWSVFSTTGFDRVYVVYNDTPVRLDQRPGRIEAVRVERIPQQPLFLNYSELTLEEARNAVRKAAASEDGSAAVSFEDHDWDRINNSLVGEVWRGQRTGHHSGLFVRYNGDLYRVSLSIPV